MMEVSVSQSSPAQFPNHENSDERNADWGELATKASSNSCPCVSATDAYFGNSHTRLRFWNLKTRWKIWNLNTCWKIWNLKMDSKSVFCLVISSSGTGSIYRYGYQNKSGAKRKFDYIICVIISSLVIVNSHMKSSLQNRIFN